MFFFQLNVHLSPQVGRDAARDLDENAAEKVRLTTMFNGVLDKLNEYQRRAK